MNIKCKKCGAVHDVDANKAGSCLLCGCGAAMIIPFYAKYGDRLKKKSFTAQLSGIRYYSPALDLFQTRDEKQIALEFDPENIYDGNAIRVMDEKNCAILGFVERSVADEVAHIGGEVVDLFGELRFKSKSNIVVAFTCYYVPTEQQPQTLEENETFAISCPLCGEQFEANTSILGEAILCWRCGAKWQITQWWTNPQPQESMDYALSNAEVQYQPKSPKALQIPPLSEVNKENRFFGKCVLFTGFYAEEKEQLAPIIDFLQMRQAVSVCQKLDFLICGSNAGSSKIQKAEEMGKAVVQATDFIKEISGQF